MKINKLYNPLVLLYLLLLSFVFIICYSNSTSFLYDTPFLFDSAIFQVVGKGWAQGKLPYVELWDLKGPIIFGLNALGYLITGTKIGVSLIQILSLFITFFFGYKILLQKYSVKTSLFFSLFGFLSLLNVYQGGDNVEEFILPLLMASFYFIYKWVHNERNDSVNTHPASYSFVYGMALAFALLTRLTNALGLCAAVCVVFVYLLCKKQWKNIGLNIITFVIGFTVILLPFVIYFALHGALYDMIYGSVLYNMEYAGSRHIDLSNINNLILVIKYNLIAQFLLGISLILIIKNIKKLSGWLWLLSVSSLLLWLLNSSAYRHYSIILLPYFYISIVEVDTIFKKVNNHLSNYVLSAICFITLLGSINKIKPYYKEIVNLQPYKAIIADIPHNEMSYFCAYNCHAYMYLYLNITPCYRFFTLQDFEVDRGPSLAPQMKETFASGKAKWILVQDDPKKTIIADILSKQYILAKKVNNLSLFKLK